MATNTTQDRTLLAALVNKGTILQQNLTWQDHGTSTGVAGSVTTVNILGNATAVQTGSVLALTVTAQTAIQFQDEGVNLGTSGTANVINLVGAGVTAARVADAITVTIPGTSSNQATEAITAFFDGGGAVIATNAQYRTRVPYACTINSVTLLADQSGDIEIDIWKSNLAGYPPGMGDSITAAAIPTITTDTNSEDTTLTGWTTAIAAGDTLIFNVNSAMTIEQCALILKVTKT